MSDISDDLYEYNGIRSDNFHIYVYRAGYKIIELPRRLKYTYIEVDLAVKILFVQ